jgi:predicted RNA-binding protein associated with RNAse of E/G family
MSVVAIHYRRLPGRIEVFEQEIIEANPEFVVTFLPAAGVRTTMRVDDRPVLEPGSPVVWFTYPGAWHDIGRFHLRDGTFTGIYANILTPVQMEEGRWETTDLCLDVWSGAAGEVRILDQEELDLAVDRGWIDRATAGRARREAARLAEEARAGNWPPPHVIEWDLERVRAVRG